MLVLLSWAETFLAALAAKPWVDHDEDRAAREPKTDGAVAPLVTAVNAIQDDGLPPR
jgi:hypothetical protein